MYDFFARYVSVPVATPFLLAVGGLIVGAIAMFVFSPSRKRAKVLERELEAARAEHQSYRGEVTEHFQKTSTLVANMTASYKAVYDHLAQGAHMLCEGQPTALEDAKFGVPIMIAERSLDVGELAQNEAPPVEPEAPAPERHEPHLDDRPQDDVERHAEPSAEPAKQLWTMGGDEREHAEEPERSTATTLKDEYTAEARTSMSEPPTPAQRPGAVPGTESE